MPKTVKKKVCVSTKAHDHGYGHSGHGGGYDDHHAFVEVSKIKFLFAETFYCPC